MATRWDVRFMEMARQVAQWSRDPDRKVGCVVVSPDRRQQSIGYNGFPAGLQHIAERYEDRDTKNGLTVHAELNAILNARSDLSGWTLYTSKSPCLECCKAIIQAGIARVVHPPVDPDSRWVDSQIAGLQILEEVGTVQETL